MPLPQPRLENRTYDQLVQEGRSLIPRYAPEWTDHNYHDPGITLLEMFAWLTETDLFRLDRVSAASFRTFLRLLGVELAPAQVAETILCFNLDSNAAPLTLAAGLQVVDDKTKIVFQTTQSAFISTAGLAAVYTGRAPQFVNRTNENHKPNTCYQPFGLKPQCGDALYLGFDRPLASEHVEQNLYVWTCSAATDRKTRADLIAEWNAARADAPSCCPPGCDSEPADWREHYSARTVWEYYARSAEWKTLSGVTDETRGLSLSGAVRFMTPLDHAPGGPDATLFFLRCRLASGGYECPPEIDTIALNAIPARHAADVENEQALGTSTGTATQRFELNHAPIVPHSTRLQIKLNGVPDEAWREAWFWDGVGAHERAYQLSPERGEITFGNGRVGRVPPADAELTATFQIGGGAAGNVPAGCLTQILDNAHNAALVPNWQAIRPTLHVTQPYAAEGGAEAETLPKAQTRAFARLSQAQRAVTLADFETLALATPGVPIARVHALADYAPELPYMRVPGSVTLVVIPICPDPQPTPGPAFLRAVERYLARRRTLTTEVHVVAPCYTRVIVHARLHLKPGAQASPIKALAQQRLDTFFHPLHGGPAGTGWAIGRDVYRAEIMAQLGQLPGVLYVDQFGLAVEGDDAPHCENLSICPDCLIGSGQHQIEIVKGSAAQ